MSNRVEQLEATVSELESTVRGLTEELVETKERLRALEAEAGVDAADLVDGTADTAPTQEADPDEVREAASQADDTPAVETPSEETPSESEASEEDSSDGDSPLDDDIIVA